MKTLKEKIEEILGGHYSGGCCDEGCNAYKYSYKNHGICNCGFDNKVKQLLSLFTKEKEKLIKEIKSLKKETNNNKLGLNDKNTYRLIVKISRVDGYNNALDDIINLIKEI